MHQKSDDSNFRVYANWIPAQLSIKAFVNSTNPKEATVFCQFFRVLTNIDIPAKEVLLKTIQGITSKLSPLTRDLFFTQRNAHAVTKTDLWREILTSYAVRESLEHLARLFNVIIRVLSCLFQCKIPVDFFFLARWDLSKDKSLDYS